MPHCAEILLLRTRFASLPGETDPRYCCRYRYKLAFEAVAYFFLFLFVTMKFYLVIASQGLSQTHAKNVTECPVVFNVSLAKDSDDRKTVHVGLKITSQWISGTRNSATAATYEPGDHIGVFAVNDKTLVTGLIDRLGINSTLPPDGPLQLQTLAEQKGIVTSRISIMGE